MGSWLGSTSVRSIEATTQRSSIVSRGRDALSTHEGQGLSSRGGSARDVRSVVALDRCVGTHVKHGVKVGIVAIAIAATLIACTDADDEGGAPRRRDVAPPAPAEELAPAGYEVIDIGNAGSIAGSVRFIGSLPELAMLPVRAHHEVCGDEQPSAALSVGGGAGLADAVVWIHDARRGAALEIPAEPATITLQGCRYRPHVLAVAVGASIRFQSADAILHNVHALRGDSTVWDFALPSEGSSQTVSVDEPGIVRLLSDVHSFMQGWVHAFGHPYFAVSDAEGRFRIGSVPPGQYVVRVWHEGWRVVGTEAGRPKYSSAILLSRTLSVSERQETTVDFELSRTSGEIAGE
jgi:plastocyanin